MVFYKSGGNPYPLKQGLTIAKLSFNFNFNLVGSFILNLTIYKMLHWPYKMLNVRHGHESRLWFDPAQPSVLHDDFERFSTNLYSPLYFHLYEPDCKCQVENYCVMDPCSLSWCTWRHATDLWKVCSNSQSQIFNWPQSKQVKTK